MADTRPRDNLPAKAIPATRSFMDRIPLEERIMLYVIIGMAVQLTILRAITWVPGQDISVDAPYHITMADLFGQLAWRKTFPSTAQSIWATCFADKELGFHLLLASIRRWAGVFGFRGQSPPFFLESAILVCGLMGAFWAVLRSMNVRQPFLFLPLLLFSCPLFTLRVNMVRPHVTSIILMMLTAALLLDNPEPKRTVWRMGCLGFLFSYFY